MELDDLILRQIKANQKTLFTTIPAQIVEITKAPNGGTLVSVQTGINYIREDNRTYEDNTLDEVNLVWPSSGGCSITCPVDVGDTVLVHFSMRNASTWKRSGSRGEVLKPISPFMKRSHDINDAFAVPAALFFNDVPAVDMDAVRVSSGVTEIRVCKNGTIELGEGATERILLGDAFKAFMDEILLAIKDHTHPEAPTVSAELATMATEITEECLSEVSKTK